MRVWQYAHCGATRTAALRALWQWGRPQGAPPMKTAPEAPRLEVASSPFNFHNFLRPEGWGTCVTHTIHGDAEHAPALPPRLRAPQFPRFPAFGGEAPFDFGSLRV